MLILFIIPLSLVIYWFVNYLWYSRCLTKFPGPVPLPVVGSALNFINPKNHIYQLLKYGKKYKGDFKLFMGFKPVLFVSQLKTVEALLTSTDNIRKPEEYKFISSWLGNGLLLSNGDYWRKHRKIITPAFHFQILDKYIEVFNESGNLLVHCLKDRVDKAAFDIFPVINLCTLDIMCEAAMGTSVNALKDSDSEYVRSVKHMGRIAMDRFFSVFQKYDCFYRFYENYKIEEKALKVLHSFSYKMIDQRRQENIDIISEVELSSKKKLAFLDLLLFHGCKMNSLTDKEIREEVDTLLFEGHDTISSTISFLLHNLANNQDVQEKVYTEISSILGDNLNTAPTSSDLKEMKYLEMVIKESLRVYPSVPFYARQLISDIECGDKVLPKGMLVAISVIGLQRDPNIYPNPEKFDPERFSLENSRGRSPFAYIPFSAGPRNCIGQKFAIFEVKCLICKLLMHYQVLPTIPAQKLELILETIMRSEKGIQVRLKKRSK